MSVLVVVAIMILGLACAVISVFYKACKLSDEINKIYAKLAEQNVTIEGQHLRILKRLGDIQNTDDDIQKANRIAFDLVDRCREKINETIESEKKLQERTDQALAQLDKILEHDREIIEENERLRADCQKILGSLAKEWNSDEDKEVAS